MHHRASASDTSTYKHNAGPAVCPAEILHYETAVFDSSSNDGDAGWFPMSSSTARASHHCDEAYVQYRFEESMTEETIENSWTVYLPVQIRS
jgi:hypothetical protein